jgi:hypothetical protein
MLSCDFCEKVFKSQKGLNYHLLNGVCKKKKYVCDLCLCNKCFANKSGQIYHVNNLVCCGSLPKKPKIELKIKDKDQYIRNLYEENLRLRGQIEALKENPQTINQIDKQINMIFPQAFGTEEINYILSKVPNLLHDALTLHVGRSIEYITEKIHCNKEVFPEYTNVYIRGYKSPFALVSDGQKFQHKLGDTPISDAA